MQLYQPILPIVSEFAFWTVWVTRLWRVLGRRPFDNRGRVAPVSPIRAADIGLVLDSAKPTVYSWLDAGSDPKTTPRVLETEMNVKDAIRYTITLAQSVTESYLNDLEDEALTIPPADGANPIAFQLGHLILSERHFMEIIRPGISPPLPEGFEQAHSKKPEGSSESPHFLSKAEYQRLFKAQREATLQILDQVDESEFDNPSPESMQSYAPTFGSLFLLVGGHELMHSGQFAVVRRKLGKPIVI